MKRLTKKQKDFLALGKRMKEVIKLSEHLTLEGDPVILKWMQDVEEAFRKHSVGMNVIHEIWSFETLPAQYYLFDVLTEVRRILKDEGIFSEDLIE